MTVGFWYGLATGIVAGFTLCIVSVLVVMVWFDWRDGIEFSIEEGDDEH